MIKCEHCDVDDVDAYYRLTIEDFNSAEAISDFPALKSLKIEPLFSTLTASIPNDML